MKKKSFLEKITGSEKEEKEEEKIEINSEHEEDISETVEDNINFDSSDDEGLDSGKDSDKDDNYKWDEKGTTEEGQLTVDVYKTDDSIIIKSIIGGVRSEDLDISVTSDMVTIKGKRINLDEVGDDDYYYQECFWGNFSRSIILPNDIRTDKVEAIIKNGILTLKLLKIEKNSLTKIKVREE